jgi:D-3-phosphoglycerate dehydrogenase / 2-oxoglutarate reductase
LNEAAVPKKVFFYPSFTPMHRAVGRVLDAADGIEVVYGLDGDDRWRRPADTADVARMRGYATRILDDALPELHAIYAGQPRPVDRDMLERGRRLEVVFMPGSGFDTVDLVAATEHNVACINSAGVNATPVSDCAVGLMLSVSLRTGYVDRFMHREKRWIFLADLDEQDAYPRAISGKTVGIVGFGFIGREVARKCHDGFRMRVLAFDPFFDAMEADRQGVTLVDSLKEMLPQCDFVSVNCPLTPQTRGIIGEAELALMKPSAFLINTSRGGTVDAAALLAALRERRIAGAGVDCTDPEPLPDGHPLYDLENIVLSPHISGGADDTMEKLGTASATQAVRVLRGQKSSRVLNPEVLPALRARQQSTGERGDADAGCHSR